MDEIRGRKIGYVRVSTAEQDEASQLKELRDAGVDPRDIYTDHGVSGARRSRPELTRMLSELQPGDIVVVYALDRLGRDAGHVITMLADLSKRGVAVESIADGLSTGTFMGEAMMSILAVFASMEKNFIQRRTRAGLAAAREQGRVGGRPRALDDTQAEYARHLREKGKTVKEIAKTLKTSEPTVYRLLKAE
jgi:DNA invertase Pin-like site-specific DNA recombinase